MKLSINEANTIKNFSSVMSNPLKVLSELIQNGRRAGATKIKIDYVPDSNVLMITDDGQGIEDLSSLFTLSTSGWDNSTTENESPFGMGFFSTFFAADEVSVESKGKVIKVESKKAIDLEDFGEPVSTDSAPTSGTRISLIGVKLSHEKVAQEIQRLARYSNVDIYFNEALQDSPDALRHVDRSKLISTPFGEMLIDAEFNSNYDIVCQDLRVFRKGGYQLFRNVLYANQVLSLRMPDRDKLLDEKTTRSEIDAWLTAHYATELGVLREKMNDDKAFVTKYFNELYVYAPSLLCDIDYLPGEAYEFVPEPMLRGDYRIQDNKALCREEFASHMVVSNSIVVEHMAQLFAHYAEAIYLSRKLPKEHWANRSEVTEIESKDIRITAESGEKYSFDLEYSCSGDALLADGVVTFHHATKDLSVVVPATSSFVIDDEYVCHKIPMQCNGKNISCPSIIICKHGDVDESLMGQWAAYEDEYGNYLDADLFADMNNLSMQVRSMREADLNSLLSDMIGILPPAMASKLENKSLTAVIRDGKVSFKDAA